MYPYPQRTQILRLLGPTTLLCEACGAILMQRGRSCDRPEPATPPPPEASAQAARKTYILNIPDYVELRGLSTILDTWGGSYM